MALNNLGELPLVDEFYTEFSHDLLLYVNLHWLRVLGHPLVAITAFSMNSEI